MLVIISLTIHLNNSSNCQFLSVSYVRHASFCYLLFSSSYHLLLSSRSSVHLPKRGLHSRTRLPSDLSLNGLNVLDYVYHPCSSAGLFVLDFSNNETSRIALSIARRITRRWCTSFIFMVHVSTFRTQTAYNIFRFSCIFSSILTFKPSRVKTMQW